MLLGPWSQLFTGVYEQHAIPHMIGFAACIGHELTACQINRWFDQQIFSNEFEIKDVNICSHRKNMSFI